jgi:pre-mRNA-splicing factor ATP-dependent RNA helicase DHX38/PRP16
LTIELTNLEGKAVDETNYKADSQFSTHLAKTEGQSVFAKTRTLKQQREYLPAFAVREELMSCIRDNQGMSRLIDQVLAIGSGT